MSEDKKCYGWLVAAGLLAIGIALGGYFISHGIIKSRSVQYVTVKGLSEMNVEADLAFWPVKYSVGNNDMTAAYAEISEKEQIIRAYLKEQGLKENEITVQSRELVDRTLNLYGGDTNQNATRYVITQTLMVRSNSPQKIATAVQSAGKLIGQGVVLSGDSYDSRPMYIFNGLNDIKPEMIAQATQNARKSAEQFAKDADSKLGSIKYANQGSFVILPRNPINGQSEQQQIEKTVRVVSTIEYFLD